MNTGIENTIFSIAFENDSEKRNAARKALLDRLGVDVIFIASVDKDSAMITINDILSYNENNPVATEYPHSMDVIQFLERAFDSNNQYENTDFDLVYELCGYYTKKNARVLVTGMFRGTGSFDGVVSFIDFKNLSRKWSEEDKEIAKKLAEVFKNSSAINNMEIQYKKLLKEQKHKYEGKMEVFDVATNEYKTIFVIDSDTELVQLFYGRPELFGIKTKTRIGNYSTFVELVNEAFIENQSNNLNDISIKNVKARIKTQNNYFVTLDKNVTNGPSIFVFKYSPMIVEGRRSIVLSIRTVTGEAENKLKKTAELENILNYNRQFDALTDLYNRNTFIKEASNTIVKSNTYHMITFDIDRFSVYNSYYGITAGDDLLRYISSVLNQLARSYDIVYGKLSNDNFAILLQGDKELLDEFCIKLRGKMKVFDNHFALRISIGVYEIIDDNTPLNNALDYSMEAKKNNKDRVDELYCLFDDSMAENRENEQEVINAIDGAIENKEFTIYLQPKVDVNTSKIVGAEALVRWIKNNKIIPPYKFIPIFEKNGFIKQMDMYVWEETLKYLRWRMDNKLEIFPISVNVSRVFMTISSFVDDITNLCNKYNVETKYLELEITESIFMDDIKAIKTTFDALRSRGFKILMDDFGSGYSSLNVLKDIDFDVLKVDLKFFSNNDERSLKIIRSVIDLAKALNIPAIAEGVETDEYVKILKDFGCSYAQGYYYSKPIDKETFNEYVKNIGVSK